MLLPSNINLFIVMLARLLKHSQLHIITLCPAQKFFPTARNWIVCPFESHQSKCY